MFWKLKDACSECGSEVILYPAGHTMSRINERTLPGWKSCRCGIHEIPRTTLDACVPDWENAFKPEKDDVQAPQSVIQ